MSENERDQEFVLEDILKEFHMDETFSDVENREVPGKADTEPESESTVVLPRIQQPEQKDRLSDEDDEFDAEMEQSLRVIFGGEKPGKTEKVRKSRKERKAERNEKKRGEEPSEEITEEAPSPFSADLFNEIYEENRTEDLTREKTPTTTIRLGRHTGDTVTSVTPEQREYTQRIGRGEPLVQHADPEKLLTTMTASLKSVRRRLPVVFLIALPLLYLTLTIPLGLPTLPFLSYIKHPGNYVFAQLALLVVAGIVGLDILTNGIYTLFCLRPGGDTLIAVSFLSSVLHCAGVIFFPEWGGYLPVCLIPVLSIAFSMLGDKYNLISRISSIRAVMHTDEENCDTLAIDCPEKGKRNYLRARMADRTEFYDNINHSDSVSKIMVWYAPVSIVLPLICAGICALRTGQYGIFFWAWSMISSIIPTFGLYVCCALPYARMAQKCMKNGTAVGNCASVEKYAAAGNCVVTDGDLFPKGAVKLNGYKMLSNRDKTGVLAMTAATVCASESRLYPLFEKILEEECITPAQADKIEFSGHGGIRGEVNGHNVLVGTASFLSKIGIQIPEGISTRNAFFTCVDMQLCAAFSVRYEFLSRIGVALEILLRSGRSPLVASRDFNLSVDDIEERFELEAGSLVKLSTEAQVALNDPERAYSGDALVLTRDGLTGTAVFLETARRYSRCVKACTLISVLGSAIGGAIMCLVAANAWVSVITPWYILFYMAAISLPGWIISAWIRKF